MRVLTAIPQEDLNDVTAAAQAAEAAGYDGVVTMENKHNPFLALGVAAVGTKRIELATSVAIAFPRSPMVTAGIAYDLQRASRGRFVLGIGPQIRAHNEKRFSVPWTAPAPRMREYVEGMRAIWQAWERGERLDYRGQHYTFTLMTPNFRPSPSGQRMVPVTLAAVGPHMLRLAGEIADGVRLHPLCTQKYLDDAVLPLVAEGMAKSGRGREQFEVTGGGFVATGPDDASVQTMIEWVRYRVAFYGSTPAYWPVFDLHGLGELGRKLNVMSKAAQWDQMAREVSDDVVRLFAAVGTHREIVREIGQRFGGRVDALSLGSSAVPPDVVQDIRRIPTRFTGYRAA
jgi:probable F420-dependent oxidoreductase